MARFFSGLMRSLGNTQAQQQIGGRGGREGAVQSMVVGRAVGPLMGGAEGFLKGYGSRTERAEKAEVHLSRKTGHKGVEN